MFSPCFLQIENVFLQIEKVNNINGFSCNLRVVREIVPGSENNKDLKVVIKRKLCMLEIGTRNVCTMNREGKLKNVKREIKKRDKIYSTWIE